jgi:hypothetical protein
MAPRFYLVGAGLVIIGVLGFVLPGPLLEVFEVTPLLNAIHIGAGATAAFAATRGLGTMRKCGQILGYLFAALCAAAFATDAPSVANLLPLSTSNAWFHLAMTLVFLYHALLAPPTL